MKFDLSALAKEGFKIIDGKLYNKYGNSISYNDFKLLEFGWGNPCTIYRFSDFDYSEYTIEKATHYDVWYLKKNGYIEVCKMRKIGPKDFETVPY